MKKAILFAFALLFCLSAYCGQGWSDCFRFDGNEITEEALLLKPTDELTYCSALAEGDPQSLAISVEDTFDPSVYATIFADHSGTAVEGTVYWDYMDDYYKDFPIDDTYVLTETVTSNVETKEFTRTVTILPEPMGFLFIVFLGALCLGKRMKSFVVVLAVIAFSAFTAKADCLVNNVNCLQNWPFDRSVIINYTIESDSIAPVSRIDLKFSCSLNGGVTFFDLSECGTLDRDGASGTVSGPGEYKTLWTPDDSFFFTETDEMQVVVEATEVFSKGQTFEYTLTPKAGNTLLVFTTVFYGKDVEGHDYLLEDIGKIVGEGSTGIVLGKGKHQMTWYPNDDYTNLIDQLEFRVVSEDVTEEATYLVLDLESYKMRTSLQGPMEDASVWSNDACRTSELWLRRIEPSMYVMGSPSYELGREEDYGKETQHIVTLTKAYYIGVFEITQGQCKNIAGFNSSDYIGDTRPLEYISYDGLRGAELGSSWPLNYDVDQYAYRYNYIEEDDDWTWEKGPTFFYALREKTGNMLFDLPTEAQWEFACRAGTTTAWNDGTYITNLYEDGNLNRLGWYDYNSYDEESDWEGHHPVGQKLPNAWGLYDMHGNVWEWCLDWEEYDLGIDAVIDPTGPEGGWARIYRGGGWKNSAYNCRSAVRNYDETDEADDYIGFRVVLLPPETEEDDSLKETFDYILSSESSSTLPVFTTLFYGKDGEGHEYLLEDIGTLSGDGSTGITLGKGKHQIVWQPKPAYTNLIGKLELRVASEEVTDRATYLVLDLDTCKMTTSLQGPMEDASIWSNDTCRTSEIWLRRIEPGTFTMGSPEDELGRYDDEIQHDVTLTKAYYIGVFETTQKQFKKITGLNNSCYQGDTRPVESVSFYNLRGGSKGAEWPENHNVDENYYYWDDDDNRVYYPTFFYSLRKKTGFGLTFDLPSEAQWEYACRAGMTTALNNGTNLTNEWSDGNMNKLGRYVCNQNDNKGGYTNAYTTVGSYLPNAWGLYDMHGNVYEWCLDWYGDYASESITDPRGAVFGSYRVLRGGCWWSYAWICRSAERGYDWNGSVDDGYGFRIVLVQEEEEGEEKVPLKESFNYTLTSESYSTLPVFTTVFYGKDDEGHEYLLEDIGKISGDGSAGIALGEGKHQLVWEPEDAYTNLIGKLELRVESEDVTDFAKYLVLDLANYKMRTAIQGPMEDEDVWSDDACRTCELWLRRIEPGIFTMGSPTNEIGRYYSEYQHEVKLTKAFYIGVFETTQKQFQNIVGFNNSYYQGEVRPVECISYDMLRGADKGARWPKNRMVDEQGYTDDDYGNKVKCPAFFYALREKTGNGLIFDLPTEAQWEYACRAGTTTSWNDGTNITNEYSDANLNRLGRYYYNQEDGAGGYYYGHTKVGSYLPNAWGLYDMHGNIREWCLDWYDYYYYNYSSWTNPRGAESGYGRVLRGGDCSDDAYYCRSALRNNHAPEDPYVIVNGFRVVLVQ